LQSKKEEYLKKINSGNITGRDLLLFVDAVQELADSNDEVKELLQDIKDENQKIIVNFMINNRNICASLIIEDGIFKTKHELSENPDLTIKIADEDTARNILLGKISITDAYKNGKITGEGNISKVLGLGILLNLISNEFNVF